MSVCVVPGRCIQSRGSLGRGSTVRSRGRLRCRNSLANEVRFLIISGKNDQIIVVFCLLRTFTFSTALSRWLVRVAAVSVTGDPGADHLPPVTVAHTTRVAAVGKLGAVCVFLTVIQAACKANSLIIYGCKPPHPQKEKCFKTLLETCFGCNSPSQDMQHCLCTGCLQLEGGQGFRSHRTEPSRQTQAAHGSEETFQVSPSARSRPS